MENNIKIKKKMKNEILLLTLFSLISLIYTQTIIISNCTALNDMRNNLAASYELDRDVDCSSIANFIPVGNQTNIFTGSLNGSNHQISNLMINSNTNYTGLFGRVSSATIKNIILVDLTVTSSGNQYIATLAGYAVLSTIENIQLKTSAPTKKNLITNSDLSTLYAGGLVGYADRVSFNNITIFNTLVNITSATYLGGKKKKSYFLMFLFSKLKIGMIGYSTDCTITNCHNVGFSSDPSAQIVIGGRFVGGMVGYLRNNFNQQTVSKSGVVQGKVKATLNSGGAMIGIISATTNITFSELYSKQNVEVDCGGILNCGGLIGSITFNSMGSFLSFLNCYSRSRVTANLIVGGLIGFFQTDTYTPVVSFNTVYNSNQVFGNTDRGASIGLITTNNESISSSNFLFNNQSNPSVPGVGSGNYPSLTTGLNCNQLLAQIGIFNQSIWGGDSLRIEYNFTDVPNLCDTPTNAPDTSVAPVTTGPSTSLVPATNSPATTLIPSTTPPSTTQPPSTTLPPITQSPTQSPSTQSPVTQTPVTNNPSTPTPS